MSEMEFRNALRGVLIIALAVVLLSALVVGGTVGCQASMVRQSRLSRIQTRNDAEKAYYKLCQREAVAGVTPRKGCPAP